MPGDIVVDAAEYRIYKENGTYFMRLWGPYIEPYYQDGFPLFDRYPSPTFESAKELQTRVYGGDLSKDEAFGLQQSSGVGKDLTLEIFAPDSLYEPVLPSDAKLHHIDWHGGKAYWCDFIIPAVSLTESASLAVLQQNSFLSDLQKGYFVYDRDSLENEKTVHRLVREDGQEILSLQREVPSLGRTVYEYRTILRYSIQEASRTLYITEEYEGDVAKLLYFSYGRTKTAPERVTLWGEGVDEYLRKYYYRVIIKEDFTSRPSVEWLSSFGLTPYVEDSVVEAS